MPWQQKLVSIIALAVFLVTCREAASFPQKSLQISNPAVTIISVKNKIVCVYAINKGQAYAWLLQEYQKTAYARDLAKVAFDSGTLMWIGFHSFNEKDCV